MEPTHPIDAELRSWLKTHVENKSEMSVAVGHSTSWLHKLVNGDGHATIDDYVRIAGRLFGVNLPVLTEQEQKLLKACRALEETDVAEVVAYAQHREKLARRGQSKESSAPAADMPRVTKRKAHGKH